MRQSSCCREVRFEVRASISMIRDTHAMMAIGVIIAFLTHRLIELTRRRVELTRRLVKMTCREYYRILRIFNDSDGEVIYVTLDASNMCMTRQK